MSAQPVHEPPDSLVIDTQLYSFLLALWGGLVHFIGREHAGKTVRRLVLILVADLATAGFVAELTWHVARSFGIPAEMAVVLCGISGHMGSRALAMWERFYTRWLGVRGE